MPVKGQIITNPITGDVYEFLETAKDCSGERVCIKATIRNKGQYVPRHFHVLQDEHFKVISGALTILLEDKTFTLKEGDEILLPKKVAHNHYNNSDEPVVFIQTITPGLDFDYLIENLMGLAADGKSKNGKYGLMQELVSLKYLDSKSYLADLPVGIQKIMMNTIAPLGRMMGYRAIYRKYSDMEK
jgi:quercetin dioxygenase-like cupin family protein